MAGDTLPNVVLPWLTNRADQTKIQVILHEISPTKHYRITRSLSETHWWFRFGAGDITIAYQSADLSLNLPYKTFTNHYHRGQETGH